MEEKECEGGSLLPDTLYIATRGGPTQLVAVAPETEVYHSKRYDGLVVQARELDQKKRFLREQALDKERVFNVNTHNLETRIAEFRLKVAAEVAARDAQLARARDAFEATLASSVQDVEEQLAASVGVVQGEWLQKLVPAGTDEEGMLAFTAQMRQPGSRLSCQIMLTEALDGLQVTLPASQY